MASSPRPLLPAPVAVLWASAKPSPVTPELVQPPGAAWPWPPRATAAGPRPQRRAIGPLSTHPHPHTKPSLHTQNNDPTHGCRVGAGGCRHLGALFETVQRALLKLGAGWVPAGCRRVPDRNLCEGCVGPMGPVCGLGKWLGASWAPE